MPTAFMEYLKQSVNLKDKKTMAAIIGTLLLLFILPLTVIGTLQLKEGTHHLKAKAAVPPIENMPFPRILNFRYLTDSTDDARMAQFNALLVDGNKRASIDKARTFKGNHPDKLVLLYFWAASRQPKGEIDYDFGPKIKDTWPGYWMLMAGSQLAALLTASGTDNQIALSAGGGAKFSATDSAMIWEPTEATPESPADPFGKVEYVKITSIIGDTLTVERAAFGEPPLDTPKAFGVGAKIAMIANRGGQTGLAYNHSNMAPVNPNNNMRANQWLADYLTDDTKFPSELDGYEFDSSSWFPYVSNAVKDLDCNADGGADYCYDGTSDTPYINSYGAGYQNFVNLVRQGLPNKYVLGDAGFRAIEDANGAEFENYPSGDVYEKSSSDLADLEFFLTRSKEPRISYTFTKQPTEVYGGETGTNNRNRFGLVSALLFGGFHSYARAYGAWNYYEWDEDGLIHTDVTGLSPGYLGQIKGTKPDRIERYDPPDNNISNSGLDNLTDWRFSTDTSGGYEATSSQDTDDKEEGSASTKINITNIKTVGYPQADGVRLTYLGPASNPGLDIQANSEYTASFWAKANVVHEIQVVLKKSTSGLLSPEESFRVDSTWRKFYLNFETTGTDSAAKLEFRVGREIGDYWLDGVEFYQGTAEILTREFDNGLAVLNGSSVAQTFTPADLGGAYKKINGVQDHAVNDDKLITDAEPLVLGPKDGIVLLKVSSPPKIGDIEPIGGDGDVDIFDLSTLISNWGATSGPADINNDGIVDVYDLSILLSNWGP